MKRLLLIFAMIISITSSALAESNGIYLHFYKKGANTSSNTQVDRAPINVNVRASYDTGMYEVVVKSESSIDAKVFIYDASGKLEATSSTVNSKLTIAASGLHIISIQGDDWYAEGSFIM